MPVRRLVALGLAWCALAHAQAPPAWWLGFIDTEDRAFLEIPGERRDCAERDGLVRGGGAAGAVRRSRHAASAFVAPGARLAFTVADLAGHASERVLTRVVAITRETEGGRPALPGACWYLAEPRAEATGPRAVEDRVAIGVNPPRALKVRALDAGWRSHGALADKPGADGRFLPGAELPVAVRERLAALLPGADQFHVQPFSAVVERGRDPEPMWLIGATARGDGPPTALDTFATVNLVVRGAAAPGDAAPLFVAGPTGGIGPGRAAGYVAQVAAAVDLDGDGIEELILRARHYAGGNLKVLRWNGRGYALVREGAYEGE